MKMKADIEPAAWGARKRRSHKTVQAVAEDTWKSPHPLSPSRPYKHLSRSCSRFSCYLRLFQWNRTPSNLRFDPVFCSEMWKRRQMRWCRRRCRGAGECELWIGLLCSPLQQKFWILVKQNNGGVGCSTLLLALSEIEGVLNFWPLIWWAYLL